MSQRDEMVRAIEAYGDALTEWGRSTISDLPFPKVEDYVGPLLPDEDGVPPTMERVEASGASGMLHEPSVGPLYRFRAVPTTCACAPGGPFCGACEYDEDGELIAARVHAPAVPEGAE